MAVDRREFSDKVKLEIWRRAGGPGPVKCEKCQWPIRGRNFEIDHIIEEWILEDIAKGLRGPLTAADGQLLGNDQECGCHRAKTSAGAQVKARVDRIRKKAAKATKKDRRGGGFGGRDPNMKKTIDGRVIDRRTGRPWGQQDD